MKHSGRPDPTRRGLWIHLFRLVLVSALAGSVGGCKGCSDEASVDARIVDVTDVQPADARPDGEPADIPVGDTIGVDATEPHPDVAEPHAEFGEAPGEPSS